MDSIRPDDDELRGREPVAGKPGKTSRKPGGRKKLEPSGDIRKPPAPERPTQAPGGSAKGPVWPLLALLIVVTMAGAWFGWQMQQRLTVMASQLEEADYWARQSKLALARFEGELTETGESLAETGSSMEERLAGIDGTLKTVNSEIRKLWVLANEKNRPQIEALSKEQQALTGQLETLVTELTATKESLISLGGELENTASRTSELEQQQQSLASGVETLEPRIGELDEQVSGLAGAMEGIDNRVDQQLTRFRQEQSLTIEGLESRLQSLETASGQASDLSPQLSAVRGRLDQAEETLKSVDASRAQLNSRLIRLQQQVDQLRAQ